MTIYAGEGAVAERHENASRKMEEYSEDAARRTLLLGRAQRTESEKFRGARVVQHETLECEIWISLEFS